MTHLLAVLQSKEYTTNHVERTYTLHFCPAPRERVLRSTAALPSCGHAFLRTHAPSAGAIGLLIMARIEQTFWGR